MFKKTDSTLNMKRYIKDINYQNIVDHPDTEKLLELVSGLKDFYWVERVEASKKELGTIGKQIYDNVKSKKKDEKDYFTEILLVINKILSSKDTDNRTRLYVHLVKEELDTLTGQRTI